jgi:hypothetical protein
VLTSRRTIIKDKEVRITTDTKILRWTVPLVLLAIVAGRIEGLDQSDFAYPGLICITFVCLIARLYYLPFHRATILLGIFWLCGALGFYASLWVSALNLDVLRKLAGVSIVAVLAYVLFDYGRLKKWSKHVAVTAGIFISIIFYLLAFIFGYRIPYKQLDLLLRSVVILAVLMIAMYYWSHLSGKPLQWPWERRRNESGKV